MECPECGNEVPPDRNTTHLSGDEFCSDGCWENYNERAYQRQLEAYYGGDGPQTDRERYLEAWEEKRRLG